MTSETALRNHDDNEWSEIRECADDVFSTANYDEKSDYNWNKIAPRTSHLKLVNYPKIAFAAATLTSQTPTEDLLELRRLADEWRTDTAFTSSIQQQILHPAYQKIIGFGEKALHFLIDELRASDANWFWALSMISRENPVEPEQQGNFFAMKEAWLNWARAKGM